MESLYPRYSKYFLIFTTLLLSSCHAPPHKWRCTATDQAQMQWVQYSPTRVEAASLVLQRCQRGRYRPTCYVSCLPPAVRWHCIAIDKAWYWNSRKREVAIKNAIQACKNSTTLGGCRVPQKNCSMT